MQNQDVRATVIRIIQEEAMLEEAEIIQLETFENVIDSLTLLDVVCGIEEVFDIKIPDDQIEALNGLDAAVNFVAQQVAAKQPT